MIYHLLHPLSMRLPVHSTTAPAVLVLAVALSQLVAAAVPWKTLSGGGCARLGRCCEGKDNECRAEGPRMSNRDSLSCFCDSACTHLSDCCLDYRQACKPVDCELGPWQSWGGCSVRCGAGVRERTRQVLVQPVNAGRSCAATVEKVACEGTSCKHARSSSGLHELRETGKILPAAFGPWRTNKIYNPYMDIRRNLFHHYRKSEDLRSRPSYCAEFEITDAHPACQAPPSSAPGTGTGGGSWTAPLVKGATVCVECQPLAMRRKLGGRCRGHGVLGRQTRWNAATVHGCGGQWTMKTQRKDCSCPNNDAHPLSFIFI